MKRFGDFVATVCMALFLVCLSVAYAFAHDGGDGVHEGPQTTAQQAYEQNTEEAMENFIRHVNHHVPRGSRGGGEQEEFLNETRQEGVWKHKSVYLIATLGSKVFSHGKYQQSLWGSELFRVPTIRTLIDKLGNLAGDDSLFLSGNHETIGPVCTEYDLEGTPRWACSIVPDGHEYFYYAGFDHPVDHEDINPLECEEESLGITAAQVEKSQRPEDLEKFVRQAMDAVGDALSRAEGALQPALDKILCITSGRESFASGGESSWKSDSVYIFVMNAETSQVIFNGNNPELNGTVFRDVLDEDNVDIGKEILEVAGDHGEGGFVRYKWDNPAITGDEIMEDGKSPGTSPKLTYVEARRYEGYEHFGTFIFGSGIYPQDMDDGCAVAGASASDAGSAVLNMFMIMFSLCFALCLRSRPAGK
jgi:hypothetical protein